MRRIAWLSVCLICSRFAFADTTVNTETVKRMIVFIYAAHDDGTVDKGKAIGTGFLITVPERGALVLSKDAKTQVQRGALFLVTARHIVDPDWAFCSGRQPSLVYMRINKMDYDSRKETLGVEYIPLPLIENGRKKYIILEDDDTVDAAVIGVGDQLGQKTPDEKQKYDTLSLPLAEFATPEEIKALRIGDSIISAGLIPIRPGDYRNYPFFKFGNISNIPDELTVTGCGDGLELRREKAWFIAMHLIGGNSGSPIFYEPPELCMMGGIVHCTRGLDRVVIIGVQSSSLGDRQYGSADIASMTPIADVFRIIERIAPNFDLYRGDQSKRNNPTPQKSQ